MNSQEILSKLKEVSTERERLLKELDEAYAREEENRKSKLFSDTKTAILKFWELYWADEDNTEAKVRLDKVTEQWYLNLWLEADVKEALKRSKIEDIEIIREIVKDFPIDFNKCIEDAKIRLNFADALRNVKDVADLSHKLEWSFAPDDLMELMKLHRSNKFRRKIEDLLTNCNFHSECGLLAEKEYDEFEKYVMSDEA